ALLEDELAPLLGARAADHAEAAGAGDLGGGHADAARRAVDEQRLARLSPRALDQRAPGGAVGDVDRGPLGEAEGEGQRMDLGSAAERELGAGAGEAGGGRPGDEDAVARRDVLDAVAD